MDAVKAVTKDCGVKPVVSLSSFCIKNVRQSMSDSGESIYSLVDRGQALRHAIGVWRGTQGSVPRGFSAPARIDSSGCALSGAFSGG